MYNRGACACFASGKSAAAANRRPATKATAREGSDPVPKHARWEWCTGCQRKGRRHCCSGRSKMPNVTAPSDSSDSPPARQSPHSAKSTSAGSSGATTAGAATSVESKRQALIHACDMSAATASTPPAATSAAGYGASLPGSCASVRSTVGSKLAPVVGRPSTAL